MKNATAKFTPRIVKRFVKIKDENGKIKSIKSEKLYLDFVVTAETPIGLASTSNYTAHVYSSGKNPPEIRIKDSIGDARDVEKSASRTLVEFGKENKWMGDAVPVIIGTVIGKLQGSLAKSLARYETKLEAKRARMAA